MFKLIPRLTGSWLAGGVWALLCLASAASAESLDSSLFARVDDTVVTAEAYRSTLHSQARQTFYHGQVPLTELAAFRRKVGENMVLRVLLAREAERRGLKPDEAEVARRLARFEAQYSSKPDWAQHKATILRDVGDSLRQDSRIRALEAQIRNVDPPSRADLTAYYERNPDKFTQPPRVGVSIILLRVPPSAAPSQWARARTNIEQVAAQLKDGADFAELARLHSQDASADEGGDLGYLHREMLGDAAQSEIDELHVGEVSRPVQLLEGYALFRLNGREDARLRPFQAVRERVEALWKREASDNAWRTFAAELRASANVQVNERLYSESAEEMPFLRVEK